MKITVATVDIQLQIDLKGTKDDLNVREVIEIINNELQYMELESNPQLIHDENDTINITTIDI